MGLSDSDSILNTSINSRRANEEQQRYFFAFLCWEILVFFGCFIGSCVHIGLAYSNGLSTRTSHWVSFWSCLIGCFVSSVGIWWIGQKIVEIADSKTTIALQALFMYAAMFGSISGFCYISTGVELSGGLWCFMWLASSAGIFFWNYKSKQLNTHLKLQSNNTAKKISSPESFIFRFVVILFWVIFALFILLMTLFTYQALMVGIDFRYLQNPMGIYAHIPTETLSNASREAYSTYSHYRIHAYCSGNKSEPSSPTYLFESGAGTSGLSFQAVSQELVVAGKRVCWYDRAGYGYSDTGEMPRDVEHYLGELELVLKTANESGPFLLIGHSVGGQLIQVTIKIA